MRGWSYNVLYVYRRTTNANDDDYADDNDDDERRVETWWVCVRDNSLILIHLVHKWPFKRSECVTYSDTIS